MYINTKSLYIKRGASPRFPQIYSLVISRRKWEETDFHLLNDITVCGHTLLYFDVDVKQYISQCVLQIVSDTATLFLQEVVLGLDKQLLRRPSLVLQVPLADIQFLINLHWFVLLYGFVSVARNSCIIKRFSHFPRKKDSLLCFTDLATCLVAALSDTAVVFIGTATLCSISLSL